MRRLGGRGHSRAWRHLGLLGLFSGLTLLLTWPVARYAGEAIPGDAFDGWQNLWNLWWVRTALLEQHTHPFFTSMLYAPSGVSLWFQTLNIFNGLVSLPVQLAANAYWAYNAVVLFSFTLAGYGATLLALHVLSSAGARTVTPGGRARLWMGAILAGMVYTFSPFHFAHLLGHMQVFSLEFIPFYVLYLLRALPSGAAKLRRHDALLAALFLILAGLCDWYFVLYLGLFTILYVIWLLVRRRLRRTHLVAVALIAGVFLVAMSPLLAPMVWESIRNDFMRPPPGQIQALSADIAGFLLPSSQHPLWGDWAGRLRANLPASAAENTVYLGVIPLGLAVVALWRRQLRLGFWAGAGLIFAIFALGPALHVGGRLLDPPQRPACPPPLRLAPAPAVLRHRPLRGALRPHGHALPGHRRWRRPLHSADSIPTLVARTSDHGPPPVRIRPSSLTLSAHPTPPPGIALWPGMLDQARS